MQAIVIEQAGGPEQLRLCSVPDPAPAAGELCIRVRAAGVNRADCLQRRGLYPPPPGVTGIPGLEIAGEVIAAGAACSRFRSGDRVYALLAGGGYAEQVCVAETSVLPLPDGWSFEDGAAVAEAYLTAFDALVSSAGIVAGERVLVHAAASGVGCAALQLVRLLGGEPLAVVGTADKAERCRQLGASACLLRGQQTVADFVAEQAGGQGVDIVLDFVGGAQFADNLRALAVDGRMVLLGLLGGRDPGRLDLALLLRKRLRIDARTLRNRDADFKARLLRVFEAQCGPALADGRLRPVIDRVWSWREAADAHRYMEANRNIGKLILRID